MPIKYVESEDMIRLKNEHEVYFVLMQTFSSSPSDVVSYHIDANDAIPKMNREPPSY